MKNILLLTDFSENSKNAIIYALEFFKETSCVFYVLHVHKMGSYTSDDLILSAGGNIHDSIVQKPKKKLKALINELQEEFDNSLHTFKEIIDFDDFTDSINQVVKGKNIDFIVLGTNGLSGAVEIVFGSNTLNVIRKVNCKTLVVPEGFSYQPIKKALLPLNQDVTLKNRALSELHEFVISNKLKLNVLRIKSNKEEIDYDLYDQSNLGKLPLTYQYYLIDSVPTHYAINSFIQINNIDLTTIIVQKESFFERFFKGSTTTKLSNSVRVPLLVFHNE